MGHLAHPGSPGGRVAGEGTGPGRQPGPRTMQPYLQGGVVKRRWKWMLVCSVPALGFAGLAVAALVAFVADGPTAEFWFPTKGSDSTMSAWAASLSYALVAALTFAIAWSLSKDADRIGPAEGEDPSTDAR
ncbi:hypothetical protein GCM10010231_04240 [Streptomyces sindenensis]|nr:hypothetical protein GCM10010231_04240 [Streptomyces sindenensis]